MCAGVKAPTPRVRDVVLVAAWVGFTFVVELPVAFSQALDCNAQFYPGHVLVRFKPTTTAGAEQAAHTAAGALQVLTEYHAVQRLQLVEVLAEQELAGVPLTMCATALEQWYSPPE